MRRVAAVFVLVLGLATVAPSLATTPTPFTVVNSGMVAWRINGNLNPGLSVVRGRTYVFNITAPGHQFFIKTIPGVGEENAYDDGLSGNGVPNGTMTWVVPYDAPNQLFYSCGIHGNMTGTIAVQAPPAVPGLTPIGIALLALTAIGLGGLAIRRRLA